MLKVYAFFKNKFITMLLSYSRLLYNKKDTIIHIHIFRYIGLFMYMPLESTPTVHQT